MEPGRRGGERVRIKVRAAPAAGSVPLQAKARARDVAGKVVGLGQVRDTDAGKVKAGVKDAAVVELFEY